jgi:hypothetical protein
MGLSFRTSKIPAKKITLENISTGFAPLDSELGANSCRTVWRYSGPETLRSILQKIQAVHIAVAFREAGRFEKDYSSQTFDKQFRPW